MNSVEKIKSLAPHSGKDIETICSFVLDAARFTLWSGSHRPEQHHYGRGDWQSTRRRL